MNAQDFERKMNGLLMLKGSWKTNELFKAEAQAMIHEVGLEQAMGGDPVVVSGRVGALQGLLTAQERWVEGEAEGLIATGQATQVNQRRATP